MSNPWACRSTAIEPYRAQQRWLPRQDARDEGHLPEELRRLSFALAMLLRYEAPKRNLCDDAGWAPVSTVLSELRKESHIEGGISDLRTVVENSYSKDERRFELCKIDGEEYVRANHACGRSGGNKGGSRRHPRVKASGRTSAYDSSRSNGSYNGPKGGRRQNAAYERRGGDARADAKHSGSWDNWNDRWPLKTGSGSGMTSVGEEAFEGEWTRQGEDRQPVCEIAKGIVKWYPHPKMGWQAYEVDHKQIRIKSTGPGYDECSGWLQDDGTIKWDDGEVWFRMSSSAAASAAFETVRDSPGECSGECQVPCQGSSSSCADVWTGSASAAEISANNGGHEAKDPWHTDGDPWQADSQKGWRGTRKGFGNGFEVGYDAPVSNAMQAPEAYSGSLAPPPEAPPAATGALQQGVSQAMPSTVPASIWTPMGASGAACRDPLDSGPPPIAPVVGEVADFVSEEIIWHECRAKEDWDGRAFASKAPAGEFYLNLTKGELLEVRFCGSKPFLESGWSYGRSVQRSLEGWFPPDFVYWS